MKNINDGELQRSNRDFSNNGVLNNAVYEARPVLERLENEMNTNLLKSIKECASFLDIPSLVPTNKIDISPDSFMPSFLNTPNIITGDLGSRMLKSKRKVIANF